MIQILLSKKLTILKTIIITLGILCLVLLLIIYWRGVKSYQGYLPTGSKAGAISVGGIKRDQVMAYIEKEFADDKITFNLPTGIVAVPQNKLSIKVDSNYVSAKLNDKVAVRSYFWFIQKPPVVAVRYLYDKTALSRFSSDFASQMSVAKVPARFELVGEQVVVKPGNNAISYDPNSIAQEVERQLNNYYIKLEVAPKPITEPVQIAQLNQTASQIKQKVDLPIELVIQGKVFKSTRQQRFEWLKVSEDEKTGRHNISTDRVKVSAYLDGVAKQFYRGPGNTRIALYDGVETGRTIGALGVYLPTGGLLEEISTQLDSGLVRPITGSTADIASPIIYDRSYSRSSKGIGLLIADFAAEKRVSMGVVFREVNGGIYADYNPAGRFVTASIFKAFLAYAVLKKVEAGALSMQNQTIYAQSIQTSIEQMIVRSTNEPAYALHHIYGFGEIDPFLHSQGFGGTFINNYDSAGRLIGDKTTNAADVSNLMTRLAQGSLMSPNNNAYLLDLMRSQIWRSGIPTGSKPSVVADKVGFLGSYTHDAGVVYSPNGQYTLTVLTRGGSFNMIADLSRRIYGLYR